MIVTQLDIVSTSKATDLEAYEQQHDNALYAKDRRVNSMEYPTGDPEEVPADKENPVRIRILPMGNEDRSQNDCDD